MSTAAPTSTESRPPNGLSRGRRFGLALASLALAGAVWLPTLGWLSRADPAPFLSPTGIAPKARLLAAEQVHLWTDPAERQRAVDRMRRHNAEWDFMGRSFLVWALANMAMRDSHFEPQALEVMDRVIEETLRLEREEGHLYFLMPYARQGRFVAQPRPQPVR